MATPVTLHPLVDVRGLAEHYALPERSVYKLIDQGLPYVRVGKRRLRFDLVEVRAYFEARADR